MKNHYVFFMRGETQEFAEYKVIAVYDNIETAAAEIDKYLFTYVTNDISIDDLEERNLDLFTTFEEVELEKLKANNTSIEFNYIGTVFGVRLTHSDLWVQNELVRVWFNELHATIEIEYLPNTVKAIKNGNNTYEHALLSLQRSHWFSNDGHDNELVDMKFVSGHNNDGVASIVQHDEWFNEDTAMPWRRTWWTDTFKKQALEDGYVLFNRGAHYEPVTVGLLPHSGHYHIFEHSNGRWHTMVFTHPEQFPLAKQMMFDGEMMWVRVYNIYIRTQEFPKKIKELNYD